MSYDIEAVRNKLKQSLNKKRVDPDQFKPDKAAEAVLKWRFFILPPVNKGDKVKSGIAKRGMDQFFVQHAEHWINETPHACPRVHSEGADKCMMCDFGFDLLKNEKDEDKRKIIVKQWMPSTYSMVNIYFPPVPTNPEALRGKVMFFDASKTSMDHWSAALNSDDAGPEDDRRAFGVFYDENAAFCYQLEAAKLGKNNNYKSSKFIANNGKPMPIAGSAEAIQAILDQRIDLYSKMMIVDMAKLKAVYNSILHGEDQSSGGGFDQDETGDTKAAPKTESKPKATEAKTEAKETKSEPLPKEETKVEPKAENKPSAASSNEIEDLLSQLE